MEKEVLKYYNEGNNCAKCIIKGAQEFYKIELDEEVADMCEALGNGMGVGCFCAAATVSIMIFGRLFDQQTAKRMRIRFLNEFYDKYEAFDCCKLKLHTSKDGCENLLIFISRSINKNISFELESKIF